MRHQDYWALRTQVEEWIAEAKTWRDMMKDQLSESEVYVWEARMEVYEQLLELIEKTMTG